jgi:hypothetical protein
MTIGIFKEYQILNGKNQKLFYAGWGKTPPQKRYPE